MTRDRAGVAAALALAACWSVVAGAQPPRKANWLTDGGDWQRTSWQRHETLLSPTSVKGMKLLWKLQLDNQPRQLHNLFPPMIAGEVATSEGVKEIGVVAGVSDNIYGIDLDTGRQLWKRTFDTTFTPPELFLPPNFKTYSLNKYKNDVYTTTSQGCCR